MPTLWKLRSDPKKGTGSQALEIEPAPFFATEDAPYSNLTQTFLKTRGLESKESFQKFLFPSLDDLNDPFVMKGMKRAQGRILTAVEREEMIVIHGDYDVDGVTGAAILGCTLERLHARFVTFLPERDRHGYGVSMDAVKMGEEKGAKLFITVDCGIQAFRETEEAISKGMDVIIIDHHRIHDHQVPNAIAILNPLQDDCHFPFKELSAGALAFKLAQALLGRGAYELLGLVSLSLICDLAPLQGENRVLVSHGLDTLSLRKNIGLKKLCESAKVRRKKVLARDLGFSLGPRINAMGRLGSPMKAFELLMTKDEHVAAELAQVLERENGLRRKEDRQLLDQALQTVEREINFKHDRVIVVAGDGWHPGVIGIVAQRLVERYYRPAIVIAMDGDLGKGSGRSIRGFHLFDALSSAESVLEEFGGHELAAGLKIKRSQLPAFRAKVNEFAHALPHQIFSKSIKYDLEISLKDLSPQFFREMSLMEPFGIGNPRPLFLTRELRTKKKLEPSKWGGIKWWVTDGTHTFEAVWKSLDSDRALLDERSYDMIYSPRCQMKVGDHPAPDWEGLGSVVLDVKDMKQSG